MLHNADGSGGGVKFSGKKRYEGVRFTVISVTRGWVGVKFPGKKRYVTLEWPLKPIMPYIARQIHIRFYCSWVFFIVFYIGLGTRSPPKGPFECYIT